MKGKRKKLLLKNRMDDLAKFLKNGKQEAFEKRKGQQFVNKNYTTIMKHDIHFVRTSLARNSNKTCYYCCQYGICKEIKRNIKLDLKAIQLLKKNTNPLRPNKVWILKIIS